MNGNSKCTAGPLRTLALIAALLLALTATPSQAAKAKKGAKPSKAATPESYNAQWRAAGVDARIDQNIEKYRKGDATIEVLDPDGKPVAGAEVKAHQTTHEFLFGCNAFVLGQLETAEMNKRYEDAFVKLFNFATVPLYWAGTEPTQGELRYEEAGSRDIWRRPPPERFMPFAKKYGLTLKGHPLLWHSHNPRWLPKDPNELKALYQKRFKEIASRFGDKFSIFDVVNESLVCRQTYQLYTPDRAYVAWAFQQVVPLFPEKNIMMINEVTSFNFGPPEDNRYFDQVKGLLDQGIKVKGIGFQWHYFRREALDGFLDGGKFKPAQILDTYEKFGQFNLPLYVTEITIPSAGPDGEKLQADVVRDIYRLWFSAPMMAGITWWNLGDGTAIKSENEAQGGLMDSDLNPKPAYKALDQLINHEWKTNVALKTDAKGQAQFRGFHGKYQVTVNAGGRSQTFDIDLSKKDSGNYKLSLKP